MRKWAVGEYFKCGYFFSGMIKFTCQWKKIIPLKLSTPRGPNKRTKKRTVTSVTALLLQSAKVTLHVLPSRCR